MEVVGGHPLLVNAAVDAVKEWKRRKQWERVSSNCSLLFSFQQTVAGQVQFEAAGVRTVLILMLGGETASSLWSTIGNPANALLGQKRVWRYCVLLLGREVSNQLLARFDISERVEFVVAVWPDSSS